MNVKRLVPAIGLLFVGMDIGPAAGKTIFAGGGLRGAGFRMICAT